MDSTSTARGSRIGHILWFESRERRLTLGLLRLLLGGPGGPGGGPGGVLGGGPGGPGGGLGGGPGGPGGGLGRLHTRHGGHRREGVRLRSEPSRPKCGARTRDGAVHPAVAQAENRAPLRGWVSYPQHAHPASGDLVRLAHHLALILDAGEQATLARLVGQRVARLDRGVVAALARDDLALDLTPLAHHPPLARAMADGHVR